MDVTSLATALPLRTTVGGKICIGSTRVTLDTVVGIFKNGATCEEIVYQFPVLELADVYAVIGFYLRHQTEVDQYLSEQMVEVLKIRSEIEQRFQIVAIRERLSKRRQALQSTVS
jgi:uncharacterized protein (DUF433 family)